MFSLNLKIGYKDQILWIQKCIKRKADDKEKKGKLHWLSYNSFLKILFQVEYIMIIHELLLLQITQSLSPSFL